MQIKSFFFVRSVEANKISLSQNELMAKKELTFVSNNAFKALIFALTNHPIFPEPFIELPINI